MCIISFQRNAHVHVPQRSTIILNTHVSQIALYMNQINLISLTAIYI